jgi:hypothetical protein
MKNLAGAQYISFLDLMCCGMGGGVLLLLIMAAAHPPEAKPSPLVVVRCYVPLGDYPAAELGLRYAVPGSDRWERLDPLRPQPGQPVAFSAPSAANSGGELAMVLVDPLPGVWRFQPYLVDFPSGRRDTQPLAVTLQVIGQATDIQGGVSLLKQPGDFGQEWLVTLGGRAER